MFKDKSFISVFTVFASAIVMLLLGLVFGSIGLGRELAFYFLSALVIASAIGVVSINNMVYSGFLLVLTFVSLSGIYALLNADFLAAAQILINGGAVTIMVIFAVMLTNNRSDSANNPYSFEYKFIAFVLSGFGLFLILFLRTLGINFNLTGSPMISVGNASWAVKEPISIATTQEIGKLFFTKYLIPFEVASVLLLMALIGAIVLALKDTDIKEDLINEEASDVQSSETVSVGK